MYFPYVTSITVLLSGGCLFHIICKRHILCLNWRMSISQMWHCRAILLSCVLSLGEGQLAPEWWPLEMSLSGHVGSEYLGNDHTPVLLLVVFYDGHDQSWHSTGCSIHLMMRESVTYTVNLSILSWNLIFSWKSFKTFQAPLSPKKF